MVNFTLMEKLAFAKLPDQNSEIYRKICDDYVFCFVLKALRKFFYDIYFLRILVLKTQIFPDVTVRTY